MALKVVIEIEFLVGFRVEDGVDCCHLRSVERILDIWYLLRVLSCLSYVCNEKLLFGSVCALSPCFCSDFGLLYSYCVAHVSVSTKYRYCLLQTQRIPPLSGIGILSGETLDLICVKRTNEL